VSGFKPARGVSGFKPVKPAVQQIEGGISTPDLLRQKSPLMLTLFLLPALVCLCKSRIPRKYDGAFSALRIVCSLTGRELQASTPVNAFSFFWRASVFF